MHDLTIGLGLKYDEVYARMYALLILSLHVKYINSKIITKIHEFGKHFYLATKFPTFLITF